MRCPYCGSPVESDGPWWVCYWCGSSCDPEPVRGAEQTLTPQITLTLSLVYHVDLSETWNDLKNALGQIAPKNALLSQLLGKVLLHHISAGIQRAGALPDEKKAEELRTFLTTTTDLNLGENAEEIMRDAKRGVLFREEAALSETDCGRFWAELLSTRPVEDYYNRVDSDGLFELFSELSSAYAYFGGKKDEEMGEAQDYRNALEEAYHTHWQDVYKRQVYRQQGVDINEKHIEVIIRQMMRKVRVEDPGDTELLSGTVVDVYEFEDANDKIQAHIDAGETDLRLATDSLILMGITKASLATESWLSAASFQETTKVLTDAAIKGKVDHLVGLKAVSYTHLDVYKRQPLFALRPYVPHRDP